MYNRIILIGRLTTDPELKTTPTGTNVTSFSIAVDRGFKTKDGEKQTDFINIQAWRTNAEFICKYFSKGKLIGIEGSLQSRNYTDKEGNKRTSFEVVADRAFFTESKGTGAPAEQPSNVEDFEVVSDEDLPF